MEPLYRGDLVREKAEGKGLNPTKVAAASDLSANTVLSVYKGEDVRVSTLKSVAKAVGVEIADLFEGKAA